jgi:filamentous hemagglutinin
MFGGSFQSGVNEQEITSMMVKAGPGSRGIVYVTNGGVGHVFNVINEGGMVRFFDYQVGEEASLGAGRT